MHWGLPFLKRLLPADLCTRLRETQCDPSHQNGEDESVYLYNSKTGEQLKELHGPGMIRISRGKLRKLCSSEIQVMFGKTLTNVTYNENDNAAVTAHFADGSSCLGDIIIGADGPRSKVRELLLGVEKSKTSVLGVVQNSTLVRYDDAEKAKHVRSGSPTIALSYHPEGIFHAISSESLSLLLVPQPTRAQIHNTPTSPRRTRPPPPRNMDLPPRQLPARRSR